MSLTSFLKIKDVKNKFEQEFSMPVFNLSGELMATPNTANYSLVGTAFDYLLRFYLKRLNPAAIAKDWVAEHTPDLVGDKPLVKKIKAIIKQAKNDYASYLASGEMTDQLLKSCLLLAQLDPIYRAGVIDKHLGQIEEGDVEDLKNLIKLINSDLFKAKNTCLLNPTFGKASFLVGGADADFIIDNSLVDIKTTKFLKLKRKDFNQLIGYYLLSIIGGIDNSKKKLNIEFICLYYSRHGLLFKIPVKEVLFNHDLDSFRKWFVKRAEEHNF